MRGTKAWMLRQDGTAFEVIVHFYASGDEDLSSEAECAAFLIKSGSKDMDLAYQVLDAWMALLIENSIPYDADESKINKAIADAIKTLPYHFQYNMTSDELLAIHNSLGNYNDIDTLYDYIDGLNINKLQEDIRMSINQQFCRVRYGGRLDAETGGQGAIWFRISSVNYNWANTIYVWVTNNYRGLHIDRISICRDYESDYGDQNGKPDYFYKAKDGTPYFEMPIDEYLVEEHEHSPVFSTSDLGEGVIAFVKSNLMKGQTIHATYQAMNSQGLEISDSRMIERIRKSEVERDCIDASQFMDNANVRTRGKLLRVGQSIMNRFPEISVVDIDVLPRNNSKGNPVGCEVIYTIESEIEKLDHAKISTAFTKDLSTITPDGLLRMFTHEYLDYCRFANISREV